VCPDSDDGTYLIKKAASTPSLSCPSPRLLQGIISKDVMTPRGPEILQRKAATRDTAILSEIKLFLQGIDCVPLDLRCASTLSNGYHTILSESKANMLTCSAFGSKKKTSAKGAGKVSSLQSKKAPRPKQATGPRRVSNVESYDPISDDSSDSDFV
jgi:hypothetical protein